MQNCTNTPPWHKATWPFIKAMIKWPLSHFIIILINCGQYQAHLLHQTIMGTTERNYACLVCTVPCTCMKLYYISKNVHSSNTPTSNIPILCLTETFSYNQKNKLQYLKFQPQSSGCIRSCYHQQVTICLHLPYLKLQYTILQSNQFTLYTLTVYVSLLTYSLMISFDCFCQFIFDLV